MGRRERGPRGAQRVASYALSSIAPYANSIVGNVVAGASGELLKVDGAPDNTIEGNLFNATGPAASPEAPDNKAADPAFADAGARDYRLAPDSEYAGLGAAGELPVAGPGGAL